MTILARPMNDRVTTTVVPLTALNLYLERVKSVTNNLRMTSAGYEFLPFQMGGFLNQQQALVERVPVALIDFKLSGEDK